jgi:hypothetical protein
MSEHHKLKKFVWPEKRSDPENIVYVCRNPCHDALEILISQKENALLRSHPELYYGVLRDLQSGKIDPWEVVKKKRYKKQKKRR